MELTIFVRIIFMHNYSLIIIHLKTMGCLVIKNQDKDTTPFVEYNVTEDNKNLNKYDKTFYYFGNLGVRYFPSIQILHQ